MPKILRAYGPVGLSEDRKQWNWCEGQPVNVHGLVCCNSPSCGCDRSFTGIDTLRATTKAIVEEVTPQDYLEIRERLRNRVLKGWNNNQETADSAVEIMDWLGSELLVKHEPGQVVTVLKADDSVELTPFI